MDSLSTKSKVDYYIKIIKYFSINSFKYCVSCVVESKKKSSIHRSSHLLLLLKINNNICWSIWKQTSRKLFTLNWNFENAYTFQHIKRSLNKFEKWEKTIKCKPFALGFEVLYFISISKMNSISLILINEQIQTMRTNSLLESEAFFFCSFFLYE